MKPVDKKHLSLFIHLSVDKRHHSRGIRSFIYWLRKLMIEDLGTMTDELKPVAERYEADERREVSDRKTLIDENMP